MANVYPIDPEACVTLRSKPASRLARIIAICHPQLLVLARECHEAAYPPEFAERAARIAADALSLSADMRAVDASVAPRASHFINRVLAGVTVDE